MEIDKGTITSLLRERGQTQDAGQAEQELPEKVDTERDSGMLQKFGIDQDELIGKVTGGRDIPGF